MHVFLISTDDYHQGEFAQTVVFNAVQGNSGFNTLDDISFFFVVIDVKLHVVDLLLLKPVHAVLQTKQ